MDENKTYPKKKDGTPISLETRISENDRLFSPSAGRNKSAIADIYRLYMPHEGNVLEIGCGSGEHAVAITEHLPNLTWYPSDPDDAARASVAAWAAYTSRTQIKPPRSIDVTQSDWHTSLDAAIEAVLSLNMIHIAPFEVAIGLIEGAATLLPKGGKLFFYGPFSRDGEIAPSNAQFDADLKRRDSRWGVRDLERDIFPLTEKAGFSVQETLSMPANNMSVIFQKEH